MNPHYLPPRLPGGRPAAVDLTDISFIKCLYLEANFLINPHDPSYFQHENYGVHHHIIHRLPLSQHRDSNGSYQMPHSGESASHQSLVKAAHCMTQDQGGYSILVVDLIDKCIKLMLTYKYIPYNGKFEQGIIYNAYV